MGVGLSWTSHHVTLCEARRRGNSVEILRTSSTPLSPRALVPSFNTPNIQNLQECDEALAMTLSQAKITRSPVAVSLPDPSVRIRLLSEEPQGGTREEKKRLLAWQLRDSLPFPPDQARLDYLSLSTNGSVPPLPGEHRAASPRPPRDDSSILCLIASSAVISQYEEILRRHRLFPVQIGASSLSLWNLWEASSQEHGAKRLPGESLCFLFVEDTHATVLIFTSGRPRFWRCLLEGAEALPALIQEVGDSLCSLTEEGALPDLPRVLVHSTGTLGGEIAEALRRNLDLTVEQVEWIGSFPHDPALLPALGASLFL